MSMNPRHAAALALVLLLFGCSSQPKWCYCSASDPDNCACVPMSTYLSCKLRYPGDSVAQSHCMWGGAIAVPRLGQSSNPQQPLMGNGAIIGSNYPSPTATSTPVHPSN